MTDLAATISGGLSASSLGKGIADAVKGASDMAKKGRQELWNKTGGQVTQRIDKALFNSGAMADKERNERKANNAKDFSNKSAMAKAGNKAKQDYINKNKVALSGMSKDEQRKTLKGVEDAAQTKAGKDLGLNDKDINRLKNDKGFKFEGDTLGGAAASALQQRFMGGKTLNESLSDKSSDLKLSVAQASGKGLSTEDAKTLKDNIAKGNVDVEKNTAAKLSDATKTVSGVVGAMGGAMSSTAKAASETSAGKAIGGAISGVIGTATSLATKGGRNEAGKAIGGAISGVIGTATNVASGVVASLATKGGRNEAAKTISKAAIEGAAAAKDSVIAGAKFAATNPVTAATMAVTAPLKAAAGAVKTAGNTLSSIADNAEKMADPKGYEATKQLEKEGVINRMAAGTNFARPDEEKKMIQDRVKQNENERKSEIKTPDLNTMTGIAKEEAYNKEIAAIDPNTRLSEQIGARMTAAAKRYNPMGGGILGGEQGAKIKKETKKDLLKAAKEQGKEKLAAVKGDKGKLEEGRVTAMEAYDKATDAVEDYKKQPEFTERAELVKELTEKAQKTHEGFTDNLPRIFNSAARKEDKEARKAQSQLRQMGGAEDPKLAELTKKQDLVGAAVRQIDTKLANIEEKLKATEEFDTAATTANEIIEEGQQRGDLLRNKDEELNKSEATTSETMNPINTPTNNGSTTGTAAGGATTGGATTSGSTTSGTGTAAPRNEKISNVKDKQTAAKEKVATATEIKENAAEERPTFMKRIAKKLAGKPLDPKEQSYQDAVKKEKESKKELDDVKRLGNAVAKANALSNHARELMTKEDEARDSDPKNQTPHSASYQRAEKLVKKYDSLKLPEDAEKFVQEQEERSKAIAKASKGLDSPEEFKKFAERFDGDNGKDEDKQKIYEK